MTVRPVLLPAEIRVREFDAKLLLACCLAERGVPCYLGQRTELDMMAGRFPQSVYVAKGLTRQTMRHFLSARNFGHEIVAWDEEAICYLTRDIYIGRRWSDDTVRLVSELIAWGEDNAEMWRDALDDIDIPIHVLGNPRADLLRSEFHASIDTEAEDLRQRYGRYILLNSNFGSTNNIFPERTRFREGGDINELHPNDRIGFNTDQAEYKRVMFRRMLEVPAELARSFPDTKIIVRPHPAENPAAWRDAAAGHDNVEVIHEGGVLPWIKASACVVHSSCTTAVEAFMLDVPAIALRYPGGHACDDDLPNLVSYSAAEKENIPLFAAPALAGGLPVFSDSGKSRTLLKQFIASLDGPLASDRIADYLAGFAARPAPQLPGVLTRTVQTGRIALRALSRSINARREGHPANPAFREHQFPVLTADEANGMIDGYARLFGRFDRVRARRIAERVFEIRSLQAEADTAD